MSIEKNWTPGPWSIEQDDGRLSILAPAPHNLVYVIAERIGGQVRPDANGRFTDRSEVNANASLLLAAPDLYEALLDVCTSNDEVAHPQWKGSPNEIAARAALAKARGAQ